MDMHAVQNGFLRSHKTGERCPARTHMVGVGSTSGTGIDRCGEGEIGIFYSADSETAVFDPAVVVHPIPIPMIEEGEVEVRTGSTGQILVLRRRKQRQYREENQKSYVPNHPFHTRIEPLRLQRYNFFPIYANKKLGI